MKLDVSVKNLGQIREATFNIRPMTVITGPNGTGKSFFTKSLYSILNVINKNVYHEKVNQTIRQTQLQLDILKSNIKYIGAHDFETVSKIQAALEQLKTEFEDASSWKIDDYLAFAISKVITVETIKKLYEDYLHELNKKPSKKESIRSISEAINKNFGFFLLHLKSPEKYYSIFFAINFEDELKENFQISDIDQLISFGQDKIHLNIDGLLEIELEGNKKISVEMGSDFIDDVKKLSSVIFFESPAYWKVRDALNRAKDYPSRPLLIGKKKSDLLTGVPKYFYDLDIALNSKTKTENSFKSATDLLGGAIEGEFVFSGGSLVYTDNAGREISKNLVSFGMTNLGMIQALLKHNIVTQGSFIFIDEPETNLHPDWQVKLMEVLLVLAQEGVTVVITTHSSDLIKALEVKIKKQAIEVMEDFLSVHFVDVGGKLLEFDSEDKLQQLIEARGLLNLAYEELYFSDL